MLHSNQVGKSALFEVINDKGKPGATRGRKAVDPFIRTAWLPKNEKNTVITHLLLFSRKPSSGRLGAILDPFV